MSPAKITEWRDEFVKNASHAFESPESSSREVRRVRAENDRLYFDHPTAGVLTMAALLNVAGFPVGVKRVHRLMRKMGLMAVYPQKCLSKGGAPEIVNSDQGSQHTTQRWEELLTSHSVKGFIAYYNYHRPHQGLSMSLPSMKYGVAA